MNRFLYVLVSLLLSLPILAQRPPETESEYDKAYQRRVQMESINGTYIPANLPDAFVQLHKLIDKDSKQKFKNIEEEMAVQKLHFSLGRWIIINWGFYEGSRLSHSLKLKGLHHPDDMARFIIRSYHRSLNKVPIEAEVQIKKLVEQREQQRLERLKQGEVLESGSLPGSDETGRSSESGIRSSEVEIDSTKAKSGQGQEIEKEEPAEGGS